jgi:hypothetical protein
MRFVPTDTDVEAEAKVVEEAAVTRVDDDAAVGAAVASADCAMVDCMVVSKLVHVLR